MILFWVITLDNLCMSSYNPLLSLILSPIFSVFIIFVKINNHYIEFIFIQLRIYSLYSVYWFSFLSHFYLFAIYSWLTSCCRSIFLASQIMVFLSFQLHFLFNFLIWLFNFSFSFIGLIVFLKNFLLCIVGIVD